MQNRKWRIVGLMSGTSLDGLDIAFCEFTSKENNSWSFHILAATTYNYSGTEKESLDLMNASGMELSKADFAFGKFCGIRVAEFLEQNKLQADFVASHGHTVFHQPENGFTTQIGNGAAISAICGLPVVSDFRSMDVCLGGQGAPLVPIGDLMLFADYKYCLNLGGIANISLKISEHDIIAFDVCPANMILNKLASEIGLNYDESGLMARSGECNINLLKELNSLEYYKIQGPKSIGKEWVDKVFEILVEKYPDSIENKLSTVCEHIATQIACKVDSPGSMLITGGGAFNTFLIDIIKKKIAETCSVVIPDDKIIGFKEALIFAFLGLLRAENLPNALKSVTGSKRNSIGGAWYGDTSKLII